jgi:hypothetical protein
MPSFDASVFAWFRRAVAKAESACPSAAEASTPAAFATSRRNESVT